MSEARRKRERVPGRRITIHDIAAEVGLHFTTVARALKESPRVSRASVEKVRACADRLGYRADPLMSALCSYRTSMKRPGYRGNLGWINGFDSPDFFEEATGFYRSCFLGAKRRCEEIGYKLESFWLGEPGMTARRASQVIHSRGVAGLLVAPMPPEVDELSMRWEKFCSVRIGYSLPTARLSNVVSDQFGNMKILCDRLRERGFRKIGFACESWVDNRASNKWSGAFFSRQRNFGSDMSLSIHLGTADEEGLSVFIKWIMAERPEVLIVGGHSHYLEALKAAGLRVPEDIKVVSLSVESEDGGFLAGINQQGEVVGMVAVDQVVGIVRRSIVGLESYPKTTMVLGKWREGESCRREAELA